MALVQGAGAAPDFSIDGRADHTRVQLLGFGRNIYTARINPGIDQASVLALTVILDEMH